MTSISYHQDKIDNGQGEIVFTDAPGSTGKTFLLNLVLAYVHKHNGIALVCRLALLPLVKLGQTAHSCFKLPIPVHKDSTCNISLHDATGLLLHAADL